MSSKISAKGIGSWSYQQTPAAPAKLAGKMIVHNPTSSKTPKEVREEVNKIHQDIKVLSQRISELNGDPVVSISRDAEPTSSSPFVSGIRNLAQGSEDDKLGALEQLVKKICEYDRLLLSRTAPEPPPGGVHVRRKSFGTDLFTIPTHLHISDRLVDLHTQSKRVTVIKTTGKQQQSEDTIKSLPVDIKTIESLKVSNAKLSKDVLEAEKRSKQCSDENKELKGSNDALKSKISELEKAQKKAEDLHMSEKAKLDAVLRSAAEAKVQSQQSKDSAELEALRAEVAALKLQLGERDSFVSHLQDKLELETSTVQGMLRVIMGRAARLNSQRQQDESCEETAGARAGAGGAPAGDSDCINLPKDAQNAFRVLEEAFAARLGSLRNEIQLLLSVKDVLENEVSSVGLHRDMLQRDLKTLGDEHEAVKGAYDSLSYEAARHQMTASTSKQLQEDLTAAQRRVLELERLPVQVAELEGRLRNATTAEASLRAQVGNHAEELAHYKKLTETLKQKIRELGMRGPKAADNKEFLDSFEEVMREEMMTMKSAFEGKLKRARDEAEEASKRHHQEILRIQNTSPYTALGGPPGMPTPIGSTKKL